MAKNVSSKQKKAIRALLTGKTQSKAAAAAGVTDRTVSRWMQQDAFCDALRDAELQALAELCRVQATQATAAQQTLLEIMTDTEQPGGVRVRAASQFLSLLPRLREQVVLEERITELEQLILSK